MKRFHVVLDNNIEYDAIAECSMDVVIAAIERGARKVKVTAI